MKIKVSDIPESGIEKELKFPLTLNEVGLTRGVDVVLRIRRFGKKVLVDGRTTCVADLVCSRCLKQISRPMDVGFNLEYIPYREYGEKDEHELTSKELDFSFYQDDEIDIGDLIREQIILAVPMKPLCEPDCKGICSKCGTNLNEMSCDCGSDEIDTRLAPLKKLKESLKKH